MPTVIRGSHKAEQAESAVLSEQELELRRGDVLVWEGQTNFISPGTGGAAFMSIKWTTK